MNSHELSPDDENEPELESGEEEMSEENDPEEMEAELDDFEDTGGEVTYDE